MDTSPLLPRTNIPIAVKQLFGKAIGNVTLVFVLLPHCSGIRQWGTVSTENNSKTFPVAFNETCFAVFLTVNANSTQSKSCNVYSLSKTAFNYVCDNKKSSGYFMALGK